MTAVAVALFGTALAVVPWLAGGSELYTAPKLAALVVGAALAAFTLRRLQGPVRLRVLDLAWGAHLGAGLISAAVAGPSWLWSVPALWAMPMLAVTVLVSAFVASRAPRKEDRLLTAIIVAATAVAALALLEACGVPLPWEGPRRPHSTLGNRNFVGADAAVGLVLTLATLRRRGWWRLGAIAVLAMVVTITRCRSAWLGVAVAGGVALALAWFARARMATPRWMLALGLTAAVSGAALGAVIPFPGLAWRDGGILASASRLTETKAGSGRGRLDDYALATAMLSQRPLLGFGPRRWDEASSAVSHAVPGRHASAQVFWSTPNSDLARIAGEQGALGLTTLAVLLAALVHALLRGLASGAPGMSAAALGLAVYGVHGLLDAPLFRASSLVVIACLCGLVRSGSPAVVPVRAGVVRATALALGGLLLVAGALRVSASVLVRLGDGSVDARLTAERVWPRPAVLQSLAVALARQGRCDEAARTAERAATGTPHHWGAFHFVALCYARVGPSGQALTFRNRALAIEPHLDDLIVHHRQGSGDLGAAPATEPTLASQ